MGLQLRTQRMVLQTLGASEAEQVLDYFIRNMSFLEVWETLRPPGFYTLGYQEALLAEDERRMAEGLQVKLWISKKEQPDRVIGSVSLSNIVRGAFQSCHLGYRLDAEERNKGFMSEAVREVIRYAFDELELHRMEANIMPRNLASLAVVKKLGFYEEGLAYKYLKINGIWEDHLHMVLRNGKLEGAAAGSGQLPE